jgi:hypothetical protein
MQMSGVFLQIIVAVSVVIHAASPFEQLDGA